MTRHYAWEKGPAALTLKDLESIAESNNGASLIAIDGLSVTEITSGKMQLPAKKPDEKRTYLFHLEASNQEMAERRARYILSEALKKRDEPVYEDLREFLKAYPQAPWKKDIQAWIDRNDDDENILLIFIPGKSDYEPAKVYFRGSTSYACSDLLEHFTDISVK